MLDLKKKIKILTECLKTYKYKNIIFYIESSLSKRKTNNYNLEKNK